MPRVSPCSNSAINWGSTASRPACICCLIPFLVHESINNPRPGDDRSNALRLLFEVPERDFEVIFERVQAVEDMVVEALLAQFVPDLLPDGHPNSPTRGHLKFPHPDRASMRR